MAMCEGIGNGTLAKVMMLNEPNRRRKREKARDIRMDEVNAIVEKTLVV